MKKISHSFSNSEIRNIFCLCVCVLGDTIAKWRSDLRSVHLMLLEGGSKAAVKDLQKRHGCFGSIVLNIAFVAEHHFKYFITFRFCDIFISKLPTTRTGRRRTRRHWFVFPKSLNKKKFSLASNC